MYRWGVRLELHTVFSSLTDDLRLLKLHLRGVRHHNSVALCAHIVERAAQLIIVALHLAHFRECGYQVAVVVYLNAGLLADSFIIQAARQAHGHGYGACAKVTPVDADIVYALAL